eukprot:jgi/Tetstr1/425060/TSEL_015524.t1
MQPYMSAVNNFFKDHGREPMALSDLVGKVRKGLAASHVTLNPKLMRAPLPERVLVLKATTLAKSLRLELGPTRATDVRGATTAAYVIGVMMEKIKYFGDWAMKSSMMLDYIEPTVLPERILFNQLDKASCMWTVAIPTAWTVMTPHEMRE